MEFHEAEERFRTLEDQRRRGRLSPEQYRAELNQLRVTGPHGRLWMPQEQTGQWHVFHDGQWLAAEPPRPAPAPPRREQGIQGPPPRPAAAPGGQAEEGGGCGKMGLYVAMWAIAWAVIAVVVYVIWAREEPIALAGVGLAALISLVLMLANLSSQWSGQIVDVRKERVTIENAEGDFHTQMRWYAYVRRDNGRRKKVPADPHWQSGDRLEKRRGESHVRHYPGGPAA